MNSDLGQMSLIACTPYVSIYGRDIIPTARSNFFVDAWLALIMQASSTTTTVCTTIIIYCIYIYSISTTSSTYIPAFYTFRAVMPPKGGVPTPQQ